MSPTDKSELFGPKVVLRCDGLDSSEATFIKNKSPAAIIFCPKKTDCGVHQLTRKKIIADRKIIAAGDLFLVKLAFGQFILFL